MDFGGLKNDERVQGELVRESQAGGGEGGGQKLELWASTLKTARVWKTLSENTSRSQTSGLIIVVQQFYSSDLQKTLCLFISLQPPFQGRSQHLSERLQIIPLWCHIGADFPRVGCFEMQVAIKAGNSNFGEVFRQFFGKNGVKWTLQNKQFFKKFLYCVFE